MTKYLQFCHEDLTVAGNLIRQGKLVAFPTETVYGLGASILDQNAVRNTYAAKGRPSDNPLIVHVWNKSQIFEVARDVGEDALKVMDCLMPGSVTIVLPKQPIVPDCVTAGMDTVAIRMPSSQQARLFLQYCNVPVAAPSANTSSRPSPTTWQRVKEDLDGKIDAVMCGDDCLVGIESTVLDLCGEQPLILRPGVVTPQILADVLHKEVQIITDPTAKVNSPGVRYKHYAPLVHTVLNLDGDRRKLQNYYNATLQQGKKPVLLVQNPEDFAACNVWPLGKTDGEVARNFFENLRKLEKTYDCIIVSFTSKTQFAQSILNRMIRSASHNIL